MSQSKSKFFKRKGKLHKHATRAGERFEKQSLKKATNRFVRRLPSDFLIADGGAYRKFQSAENNFIDL